MVGGVASVGLEVRGRRVSGGVEGQTRGCRGALAVSVLWTLESKEQREVTVTVFINTAAMFSSLGLFHALVCPDSTACDRVKCVFSHRTDLQSEYSLKVPIRQENAPPVPTVPS